MEQHLSQYKIFYEVARTGNISKAAKELYISQPAISKAIGKFSRRKFKYHSVFQKFQRSTAYRRRGNSLRIRPVCF